MNAMKSIYSALSLFLVLPFTVSAQDILFDEPHPTDGALFLTVSDGKELLVNAHGEEVVFHPVFQKSMHKRKADGVTVGVSSADMAEYKQSGSIGPTFNLTYLDVVDGTGQGFDDPVEGATRRAALESAFAYFSSAMTDGGEADIEIRHSFAGNPNTNPFARASTYYFGSKGFNESFTQRHIITGNEPSSQVPDAYIQFNFHANMNYNYDANSWPQENQYDFYTVALHEITHMLGFSSYVSAAGQSLASPHVFTQFDGHLIDYEKNPLLTVNGTGSDATVSQPSASLFTNNQLWYELSPGQLIPVFSPSPYNGSSISHLDNGRTEHGEFVMHPSLSRGHRIGHLHEDEVRLLETLGYSMDYSIATSLEDEFSDSPINLAFSGLYPNPASRDYSVQIDIPELREPEILVIVYDMLGRESYSKVILNQGPGPVTAIDPYHNLPPGMYIVVGSSRNELFNERLVIR